jgi:hypothetical protein
LQRQKHRYFYVPSLEHEMLEASDWQAANDKHRIVARYLLHVVHWQ